MVRSTLRPGPFEGQRVLDRSGRELGEVESLNVTGQHVDSFRVRLADGGTRDVPREWFLETVPEGILLNREADDVRGLDEPQR